MVHDQAAAEHLLGVTAHKKGEYELAVTHIETAITLNPGNSGFHNSLGSVLQAQGKLEAARLQFEQAVTLDPGNTMALSNLGLVLKQAGDLEHAIACYTRLLAIDPDNAEAHYHIATALHSRGRFGEAATSYQRAVTLHPEFAAAYNGMGNVLLALGQLDDAEVYIQQALSLHPGFAEAHNNLGAIRKAQNRLGEAAVCFQHALSARPQFTEAQNNIGAVYQTQGELQKAATAYRAALDSRPDNAGVFSNLLLVLNYASWNDAETVFREHLRFAKRFEEPLLKTILPHTNDRSIRRRIRVGYVSPDFCSHSVAYFLEPVFAHHNHDAFEIFCYSNNPGEDEVTRRLRGYTDHWRNIIGVEDGQAAELIREDRIDILVDLAGHTSLNRLPIFARKPAPVQITWLGYLNTTGLSAMDYRITDRYANPPGMTDRFHTEELVRMPHSQWCYLPQPDCPDVGELPALASDAITFASFHSLTKVTPEVMKLWARLLATVPHARLLMVTHGMEQVRAEIQARFTVMGVEPDRIELLEARRLDEYFALHNRVDINLDTFPYTGGTTTCHSLWMGVPVVTLAGQTATSRGGASLLSVLGLENFIAETPDKYIEICASVVNDRAMLAQLRADLRSRMAKSPLTDAAGFTHDLERVYRERWRRWCEGS